MGGISGKILQVDGRKTCSADGDELNFVGRGDTEHANLVGDVIDAQKSDGLFEWERTGGHLRQHEQRERTRLWRIQRDTKLARVGIESPQGHEGLLRWHREAGCRINTRFGKARISHIRDGRPAGHVENQFA